MSLKIVNISRIQPKQDTPICTSRRASPSTKFEDVLQKFNVWLWGLGKELGLRCSEDEEVVTRVLEEWEVRDNEVRKSSEEGAINGDL